MPEIITIDKSNFRTAHLCCAIGDDLANRERCDSKRDWLALRFAEGLVFKRLDVRGKVFIEYMPIETVWKPLVGANCLVINCLWVSGQYQGQGWAGRLLDCCLLDAQTSHRNGIAVVVATSKKPFLGDKKFFVAHGFSVCDAAAPWFELLWLPLLPGVSPPRFADQARSGFGGSAQGLSIFWSRQCPFMVSVVSSLAKVAAEQGIPCLSTELASYQAAQAGSSPFGTLGMYWNGRFVTHELMTDKKFSGLLADLQQGGLAVPVKTTV